MNKKTIVITLLAYLIFNTTLVSAQSWEYGTIDIAESFEDKIYIRWNGPNTESCSSDDVVISATSLGSNEALDRGFKIALTAAVSGKPIRFLLDGCSGNLQQGKVVQLCAKFDCSY